jgi:hypothetical protein
MFESQLRARVLKILYKVKIHVRLCCDTTPIVLNQVQVHNQNFSESSLPASLELAAAFLLDTVWVFAARVTKPCSCRLVRPGETGGRPSHTFSENRNDCLRPVILDHVVWCNGQLGKQHFF